MRSAGDILVIDDEPTIVEFIAEALKDEGYTVCTALTPEDARASVAERPPDLVLLDLHLPGEAGDTLAHDFKSNGLVSVPIILMTADAKVADEPSMDSIAFCLIKPFDLDELVECVAKHIRPHE